MEFPCKDEVKGQNFVPSKIVLFASGVWDEIQEKFKERSLMVLFWFFAEQSLEDINDRLNGMVQKDIGVIAGDKFVADDDQFGVILNVSSVDGSVVRADRELNFLKGIA